LFLDELPEFKRSVLVVLRQPMEERVIKARKRQEQRFRGSHGMYCSAYIPSKKLNAKCTIGEEVHVLLKNAMSMC